MLTPDIEALQKQLMQTLQPPKPLNEADVIAIVEKRMSQNTGVNPLLAIIESHLEPDELAWLQKPDVIPLLPSFLSSANGHEFVQLFIQDFKDYYENQTRS